MRVGSKYYTDIHCHMLPGVDDGAADMAEAVAMLSCAEKEGIRHIILTPHQKPDRHCVSADGMKKRMSALQKEADHFGITLYPGGELFYRQGLEEKLRDGTLCTMAGSGYVLVEFFPTEGFSYIRDGLYNLLAAGYLPILAHAERYEQVCKKAERQQELLNMGCYFQVNAASLTGEYGFGIKRTAWNLIKEEKVHFVGTDAHHKDGKRAPKLKKCAALLEKKCGKEYADRLLRKNAACIFSDEEL